VTIKLKNGKTAIVRKQISKDTFVAFYSGEEGESLFLIHEDEIKRETALPYIFWDVDDKRKKKWVK
jgi:hypothetical protein